MSRLAGVFKKARKSRRAAFVAYLTAGDPDRDRTVELVRALSRSGVDVIELGVPFAASIGDSTTAQHAADRALEQGVTLADVLQMTRQLRVSEQIPLVVRSYLNPILQYGLEQFAEDAAAAGVDGLLLSDAPLEELEPIAKTLKKRRLDPILVVTPTSPAVRIKAASKLGKGFLAFVSRERPLGAGAVVPAELDEVIRAAKKASRLPVAVGSGISTPAQVNAMAALADGVVVGSALSRKISQLGDSVSLGEAVQELVTPLVKACRR